MADATEVGVGYVRLVPSMAGFSSDVTGKLGTGLTGPLTQAGKEGGKGFLAGLSSTLDNAGDTMTSWGKKLSVGLTLPLVGLGAKAIGMASDLNEALNKANVVFGDQGDVINEFATNAARNFGLSKKAALDAAGGFGNMFQQLGFGSNVTAAMSQSMIGLAADFSSFHNVDISQVLEAQSAAFRGEYDSLQRFLPLITAASVQQEAMKETGKKNADQLTAQDKALATYQLMLQGAGAAQGDFERTATGDANATRIAAAEAENAAAAFGQKLLPVKAKLVSVVGQLLDRFNKLSPAQQQLAIKAAMVAVALGPVLSVMGTLVGIIATLIGSPVIAVIAGIGLALAAVGVVIATHWSTAKQWAEVFWRVVQDIYGWLKSVWNTGLGPLIAGPLVAAVVLIIRHWGMVKAVFEATGQAVMGTVHFFQAVWDIAVAIYQWFARTFGPGLSRVWASIVDNLGPLLSELGQTAQAAVAYWQAAWPVISAVLNALGDAFSWLGGVVVAVWGVIGPAVQAGMALILGWITIGLATIQGSWHAIWGAIGTEVMIIWNFVTRVIADALAVIGNVIQLALNLFQGDWGAAWQNILNIVHAIWDMIGAFVRAGWDTVWNILSAGFAVLRALLSAVADWVRARIDDVVGLLTGIWGRVAGGLNALKDGFFAILSAMGTWARDRVSDIVGAFASLPGRVGDAIGSIADRLSAPFIAAFNAIRNKWNSTVGGFSINIPSVLGFGGAHFSIPKMHTGGIFVPQGYGDEGPAILKRGEGVFTADQMRALGTARQAPAPEVRSVVELNAGGLDRALMEWLRSSIRAKGGNVQLVLGAPGR